MLLAGAAQNLDNRSPGLILPADSFQDLGPEVCDPSLESRGAGLSSGFRSELALLEGLPKLAMDLRDQGEHAV